MKINFEEKFVELEKDLYDKQKKIDINSKTKIFYGITKEGNIRLSFLSKCSPPKIESTKTVKIVQGQEDVNLYWTCLDLINSEFRRIFFYFCEDVINSISEAKSEEEELKIVKDRFFIWKVMFKKAKNSISFEKEQGLYGELYFLNNYMIEKYSAEESINSWSGPRGYNKDFSYGEDWYEVKTTSVNSDSIKISSISQLSSEFVGKLIIIKVEKMSDAFDKEDSTVMDLIRIITDKLDSLELKQLFLSKVAEYGFSDDSNFTNYKFNVHNMSFYEVDDSFPRIKENDIKYQEIDNIEYKIFIKPLDRFKVKEL